MKKYIKVIIAFIVLIFTTVTLVKTGYLRDSLHVFLPHRLDYGQWILIYFNLFTFAYMMVRLEQPKKAYPVLVADFVITLVFCIYYFTFIHA